MMNDDEAPDTGPQMSVSELARHFKEETPKETKTVVPSDPEEYEKWQKEQHWANTLPRISARVKNAARSAGANLTPNGLALANTYTHLLKELYDFADKLPEEHKDKLVTLLRSKESLVADYIAMVNPPGK